MFLVKDELLLWQLAGTTLSLFGILGQAFQAETLLIKRSLKGKMEGPVSVKVYFIMCFQPPRGFPAVPIATEMKIIRKDAN